MLCSVLSPGMSSIATFLIVNLMQEDLAVIPSSSSVIGAFAISAAIGILFGRAHAGGAL